MLTQPMDVLKAFPIRKSKKQKEAFRREVQSYISQLGYESRIESGSSANNIVIGDPENAKFLVTAHYDTPAGLPFPNLITPCNLVTYLLYQFVIVGLFIVVSIAVGGTVGFLTKNPEAGSMAGMGVYWAMLLLMLFGPANKNNANDNTSGVVTVLETARTLPENLRDRVCFVLFDLEEAGLVGSSAYRKAHKKASNDQIVLNLDCVGDGDNIVFFPMKKLCKDKQKLTALCRCVGRFGTKTISVCNKGFRTYPSDQKHFPYGVGIAAFHRTKGGTLYCSKIHTKKDTTLEETNVNILRAALTTYISQNNEN